ncbi:branched-chain amino acid ABC transporter permease [Methylobacterium sp. NEAU 140]|uniref:branched-chain amino acid ABC transporter permease n=1 Tax=Methylobacterium sp. NEAU 140 TaxID=3064945 RepID=UPI002733ACDF|nr:branched-chain amino acid ABC transporter permease [Methylobacterium sp. NEAU 140]MDP4023975.1 branched-chain amino acid ABC transporter permease [Methylobacterium sp. NEAU 140]
MRIPLLILALGAALAILPFVGSEYALSFTVQLLMFTALAYSWNIIGGYAGYTHFGQVAFFGLGAYVGALLIGAGWHWLPAAGAASLAAVVLALVLGGAMLRLKGSFFAIGMYGLARVGENFALGFDGITQGGTGLYLTPADLKPIYAALAVIALALIYGTHRLDNARFGLQLLTIREDETAAEALGVRTTRLKIAAFMISAAAPGAVGALYATYLAFIDPATAFAPMTELTTIAMVLLGGLGTVLGPLVGAVLLSVVNELLWSRFPELYLGLVGVIILGAVLFMPRGIVNAVARRRWRWSAAPRAGLRRLADAVPAADTGRRALPETAPAPRAPDVSVRST